VKTITIRLPDVEAAMLSVIVRSSSAYRDYSQFLSSMISREYPKLSRKDF